MRRTICTLLFLASLGVLERASGAAELTLSSGVRDVALDQEQSRDLAVSLEAYFEACHPYRLVVGGEDLPQDRLVSLWSEQVRLPHAVLRRNEGAEDPDPTSGATLDVLFGFSSESGPFPVLTRGSDRIVTSYIKCPGFEGLRLSCRVHALIPGMKPSARCGEWEALAASQPATPTP
jgi:hypothetical protein